MRSRPRSISAMACGEFAVGEQDRGFRARVHHEHVGAELLEAPDQLIAIGVRGDEFEEVEVPLRVADDGGEIVDLKKAEVAVVILDAFLLQLAALLGGELVGVAPRFGAGGAALMILQERLAIVRTLAIGTAGHFHLEEAEIDPELQFLAAVEAENLAHFDGAGFVVPVL